jgi:hypothetical protein
LAEIFINLLDINHTTLYIELIHYVNDRWMVLYQICILFLIWAATWLLVYLYKILQLTTFLIFVLEFSHFFRYQYVLVICFAIKISIIIIMSRRFMKISANRSTFWTWHASWISKWQKHHKLSRGPANGDSCQFRFT